MDVTPRMTILNVASFSAVCFCLALAAYICFRAFESGRALPDYFKLSGVPPPNPLLEFNIDKAKARPYRPFRWAYHQHMSLKKMEPDWWLELESTYRKRIVQRKQLYAIHGKRIIDAMPGSELACKELMEMVLQFLCARYPKQFQYDSRTGIFHNNILDTHLDIATMKPLEVLLDNIPEDFLITLQDEKTGLYVLRAGVACSAVGWNISTKIGKPLHAIHDPVPDYKEKMEFSMDRCPSRLLIKIQILIYSVCRYFSKMPCDKPIQRGSWSLEIGQPLFVQPGDEQFESRNIQLNDLDIKDVYLRVDWQTLRRLPTSRAIVFSFKALFTPVTDFRNEPYIPKLVAKVLREGKKNLLDYKATSHVEHCVLPALDGWAREQEEKGWVPKDWNERTLDEDPYFPGWNKA
ncbi:hypothetical protein Hypma_011423 [Hypsizygus marmoreus]|uniref:Uncharacterized protein n=1 Tax=Hypsizygus marmoreus TaxID=39966 RepID=A0A369JKA8_HYPMA|nr:hypothetical protein Hypma_011423 [Hypsizygus marmoreus]